MVVMETRDRVARFRLLEPIRQYALELLETSGEIGCVCAPGTRRRWWS